MSLADFNLFDWFTSAILIICCCLGFARGMVGELMSIAVWILGFIVAQVLRDQLSPLLQPYIDQMNYLNIVSLSLIFFACLIIGSLCIKLIALTLPRPVFPWISGISGAFLGLIKAIVIVIVILKIGEHFHFDRSALYMESQLVSLFDTQLTWLNTAVHYLIDLLLAINPLTD